MHASSSTNTNKLKKKQKQQKIQTRSISEQIHKKGDKSPKRKIK